MFFQGEALVLSFEIYAISLFQLWFLFQALSEDNSSKQIISAPM